MLTAFNYRAEDSALNRTRTGFNFALFQYTAICEAVKFFRKVKLSWPRADFFWCNA